MSELDDGDAEVLYRAFYRCPDCGAEWDDTWDSACDEDCDKCSTRAVTPWRAERIINGEVVEVILY